MSNSSGVIEIEHILSLDFSDPRSEDYGLIEGKYVHFGNNSKTTIDHNNSVVEATNQAAKMSTGDVLIYLSDDFKCPNNWDQKIFEQIKDNSKPALLKADDCLQPFHKDVLTIPIMNRALYERLGYFWNPIYKSMFVDQDLYHVCANNGWIIFAPNLRFPHEHYSIGKAERDETYIRSDRNWNEGQQTYLQRKSEGFPCS